MSKFDQPTLRAQVSCTMRLDVVRADRKAVPAAYG